MALELADPEMKILICKSINTNQDALDYGISILQHWIKHQPHLPKGLSNKEVEAILVSCKNSIERSKIRIESYWSVRRHCSEFFVDRNPCSLEMQQCAKIIRYFPLPKLTPEGCRINILSFADSDPKKFSPITIMKRVMAMSDVRRKSEIYFAGDIIIHDCKGFSFAHLIKFTPTLARKCMFCIQVSCPVIALSNVILKETITTRLKEFIYFNSNQYIVTALNLFKPFMKKKLAKRIHMYTGDYTVLYKHVPKELLPKEYGGNAGTMDEINDAWQKRIESEEEWLTTICAQQVDETKRPKNNTNKNNGIFGMVGNFKTLTID